MRRLLGFNVKYHILIVFCLIIAVFSIFVTFSLANDVEDYDLYYNVILLVFSLLLLHSILLLSSAFYFLYTKQKLKALYRILLFVFILLFLYFSIGSFLLYLSVFQ